MAEKDRKNPEGQQKKTKAELTEDFQKKHRDFLTVLAQMPVSYKKEEKDRKEGGDGNERLDFYRQYPLRDDFFMEAMKAYRTKAYKALDKSLPTGDGEMGKDLQDGDIASKKHRELIDTVVYAEALNKAICVYTGKNKEGVEYNFIACIGTLYGQKAEAASEAYDPDAGGITYTGEDGLSRKKFHKYVKLVSDAKKLVQSAGREISPDAVWESVQEMLSEGIKENDLQFLKDYIWNPACTESLYRKTENDGEETFDLQWADEKNAIEEMIDWYSAQEMLDIICDEAWELVKAGKGKRGCKIFQLFSTVNVLRELKSYPDYREDKKKNHKEKNDREEEKRILYTEEPAGNEKTYQMLKPRGDFLYREIFDKDCLEGAFAENPGDFYEVYVKLLRKGFAFRNNVIAEIKGVDKSTITRWKDDYMEMVKPLIAFLIS